MDKVDWKIFVPWILAIATALIGIWQYADKSAQTNREPFLRQQLALVTEAVEKVSTLATSRNLATWKAARERFWELYWGPLSMVEDSAIEGWMIRAGALLGNPRDPVPAQPPVGLADTAYCLAHAARQLVIISWHAELPLFARPNCDTLLLEKVEPRLVDPEPGWEVAPEKAGPA